MTILFAQPYDTSATGFFFNSLAEYEDLAKSCLNDFGQPVEEFEIQFIDGEDIDSEVFEAWDVSQGDVPAFLNAVDEWKECEKQIFIIAVGECGYSFDPNTDKPDDFDVELYAMDSLRKLAEQFVEEGLYGEIPERLQFYLDYDAIARDLEVDYSETTIAGERLVYRCG